MFEPIALPAWLVWPLFLIAALAVLERVFVPSVRWFLRRRVDRVLEEFNTRLQIRLQPFKLTKRRVLLDRLQFDREVVAAAETFAEEGEMPRAVAMERVGRYAREIVPAFNAYLYFRLGYRVARAVARSLYRVRLGSVDEEGLAEVDPSSTVVFIMNHRSNMDYILVSYLAMERTALSYAVGEWARVWPLENLIRSMGAYFVRRRSKNALYRTVLRRYVHMATAEGVTQAVYPEGGLSRDGRLQEPKLGLLDYMLRDFDPQTGRDIVFVPVGLNYDRVLEDRTLLLDLDDDRPPGSRLEAVRTLVRFWLHHLRLSLTGRWFRFGYACVNFGRPISARRYLREEGLDLQALETTERFAAVGRLAESLMSSVGRAVPVVPVSLVATVFHDRPEARLSELEVKAAAQHLIEELEAGGAEVYVPRRDRDYAIVVGLRMLALRRIVDETDGLYHANPADLTLLRYYANSVSHHRREVAGPAWVTATRS